MNVPRESTPYRPSGEPTGRRRAVVIVTVAIVAIGLTLHNAGVLPPT